MFCYYYLYTGTVISITSVHSHFDEVFGKSYVKVVTTQKATVLFQYQECFTFPFND